VVASLLIFFLARQCSWVLFHPPLVLVFVSPLSTRSVVVSPASLWNPHPSVVSPLSTVPLGLLFRRARCCSVWGAALAWRASWVTDPVYCFSVWYVASTPFWAHLVFAPRACLSVSLVKAVRPQIVFAWFSVAYCVLGSAVLTRAKCWTPKGTTCG